MLIEMSERIMNMLMKVLQEQALKKGNHSKK